MRSHFRPAPLPPSHPNSQFRPSRQAALACVLSGAAAMLTGVCSAQVAADFATDPTYAGGWAAGQNGGFGFSPWSFNGTDPTPAGTYQGMTGGSAVGTAWTLFTHSTSTGLANAGRAINGGLQVGETFETVIQNPTAYHFFRGFDILFTGGPDNSAPGDNTAALRVSEFTYFGQNWGINDANGGFTTPFSSLTSGAAGMRLDLSLTTSSIYWLTLTPLSNPSLAYTYSGTYSGPISWVDYRLWDGASGGPGDLANNLEIANMLVLTPEPSSLALLGLGSLGYLLCRRRK